MRRVKSVEELWPPQEREEAPLESRGENEDRFGDRVDRSAEMIEMTKDERDALENEIQWDDEDLQAIQAETRETLRDFVKAIGMDGDYYLDATNDPITFYGEVGQGDGDEGNASYGVTLSPETAATREILSWQAILEDNVKKTLEKTGAVVLNIENYGELDETNTHENLHARRSVMVGEGEVETMGDASQEFLHGDVRNLDEESFGGVKDFSKDEKVDLQMKKQHIVDEALIDLMTVTAMRVHEDKKAGKNDGEAEILEMIKGMVKNIEDEMAKDERVKRSYEMIAKVGKIIVRHGDLDLFRWMIDPLEYGLGNVHYDYFSHYARKDGDIMAEIDARARKEYEKDKEWERNRKLGKIGGGF
ncbi:hypothetical protein IKE87_00720 [Candidatus Saccharibacteria bacterium]|nr:hypothetical protein [Candidatus Saccharibacteria bacterium]